MRRLRPGARTFPLGAGVLCLVLAGIAGPAAATRAAASPTTLRVWYGTDDPTETAFAQALATRFQATHAGVRVNLLTYALDDVNTKLQLALGGGTPPDLIYTTPRGPGLPAYLRAHKLRDLTADARANGWAASLRPGLLAEYNDGIAPRGSAGGHVYAAPFALAVVGVLYNRAIFSRLKVAVPRTLAAFTALLPRLKKAGVIPLGLGNADGWVGDDWWLTLVNAQVGPRTLRPELHLDSSFRFQGTVPRGAGALLQSWATAGYFTPQFGGLDAQDSVESFFEGHTAMQLISSSQNGQIVALARESHVPVGLFAFPSAQPGAAPVMPQSGYEGWAVPLAGRQPALATAFITQMLSAGTADALLAHGLLPARRLDGPTIQRAAPLQQAYLHALATAEPGVYLDGAPVPNLNATMEANVQLLLQQLETPDFLLRSLQLVYDSYGARASSTRTDGEF